MKVSTFIRRCSGRTLEGGKDGFGRIILEKIEETALRIKGGHIQASVIIERFLQC